MKQHVLKQLTQVEKPLKAEKGIDVHVSGYVYGYVCESKLMRDYSEVGLSQNLRMEKGRGTLPSLEVELVLDLLHQGDCFKHFHFMKLR